MPLPLDPITRRKLVTVKQLYQQAVDLLTRSNDMSRVMCAITFDLSVETVLKLVMRLADSSKTPKSEINELVQQLDTAFSHLGLGTVPDRAHIGRVRSIRNAAQHEARVPNTTELSECHIYTRDFLVSFVSQVWDIAFKDISLVASINHATVRAIMEQAEIALNHSDYEAALKHASIGLMWAINRVQKSFLSRPFLRLDTLRLGRRPALTSRFKPQLTSEDLWRAIREIQKEITEEFKATQKDLSELQKRVFIELDATQNALLFTVLNMDYVSFLKFQSIAGNVTFYNSEPNDAHVYNRKETLDQNDIDFVFHYCVDAILQIEARVEDIDRPFSFGL